ncbi:Neuroendocrine secretory protein 55 [Sciurus carolinensis]|uniref:Neuroendocrine secretory protein 55 n=1 Tax=Sciurus carolinensis TaxID=30640 RepID=A0AA41T2Y0_SCICA|nr:Neuroendocrine secretory protein 55 [Sciurus carolinensis]
MDRRSRAQQWRRARHNYNDLCPPIGRRAATALLWLSCSIALLRALATSNARAQQRAAAQQRRSFLNAHHRSSAQRLQALKLQSPDASPSLAQPTTQESESPSEGEEPEPEDKDPRDPEESEEPKEKKQQRRCKPRKPTRRDRSPESPSKRGPIPIRRH